MVDFFSLSIYKYYEIFLIKKTYFSYLKYCLNVTKIDTTLPYFIGCTYLLFEEMNSISLRLSFRSSVVLYM